MCVSLYIYFCMFLSLFSFVFFSSGPFFFFLNNLGGMSHLFCSILGVPQDMSSASRETTGFKPRFNTGGGLGGREGGLSVSVSHFTSVIGGLGGWGEG